MNESLDRLHAQLFELCEELAERTKMVRDYGTTPGSSWLARSELERINQLSEEVARVLAAIQKAEEA